MSDTPDKHSETPVCPKLTADSPHGWYFAKGTFPPQTPVCFYWDGLNAQITCVMRDGEIGTAWITKLLGFLGDFCQAVPFSDYTSALGQAMKKAYARKEKIATLTRELDEARSRLKQANGLAETVKLLNHEIASRRLLAGDSWKRIACDNIDAATAALAAYESQAPPSTGAAGRGLRWRRKQTK